MYNLNVLTVSIISKITCADPPAIAIPSRYGTLNPSDIAPDRSVIITYNISRYMVSTQLMSGNMYYFAIFSDTISEAANLVNAKLYW